MTANENGDRWGLGWGAVRRRMTKGQRGGSPGGVRMMKHMNDPAETTGARPAGTTGHGR